MTPEVYLGFFLLTLSMICLDLWQTRGGEVTIKKAASWSLVWFMLALLYAVFLHFFWDQIAPASSYTANKASTAFLTGYLLEKSLSVDNLFVFAIIFQQYSVPNKARPRALLFGVMGALVLRAILISVGANLLEQFHWLFYGFAAFLIWTGIKLFKEEEEEDDLNPLPERLLRKYANTTDDYHGTALSIKKDGRRFITPLAIVIGVISVMDVMFALDSIPAIFAVTDQPFLVLSANVFALLGLRSLYFVLQGMIDKFVYLRPALAVIMLFIGIKMAIADTQWAIPTSVSLLVLLCTMTIAVILSVVKAKSNSLNNNEITDTE